MPATWSIIDIIVPQGKWARNAGLLPKAGRHYLDHLLSQATGKPGKVAVFSMLLDIDRKDREHLLEKGVSLAFGKREISFVDLLKKMKESSSSETPEERN